jgi:hypothetical protein
MDLESLVAIDVHTHAEVSSRGGASLADALNEASAAYFKIDAAHRMPTLAEIAAYYRERDMAAVVFTVDAEHATGIPPVPNEEIAEAPRQRCVLIRSPPSTRSAAGRARRGARWRALWREGFQIHPNIRASSRTTGWRTACMKRSRNSGRSPSSTPVRPASVPVCPAAAGSG